jgi:hypothetical protein
LFFRTELRRTRKHPNAGIDEYELAERKILDVVEHAEKAVATAIQDEVETLFPKMNRKGKATTNPGSTRKMQNTESHHVVTAANAKNREPHEVVVNCGLDKGKQQRWYMEEPYSQLLEQCSQYAIF